MAYSNESSYADFGFVTGSVTRGLGDLFGRDSPVSSEGRGIAYWSWLFAGSAMVSSFPTIHPESSHSSGISCPRYNSAH
jgi:hypothetical protein